ncbi:MAG: hypothetical protein JWP97_3812 [Labilithrix sp.]|nr:hypothetical protein [Labilithrix sp.]
MNAPKYEPEERWTSAVEEAQRLIAARDTDSARTVLAQLVSFVDRTRGPDDVRLIRPLRLMAATHFWEHEPLDPDNEEEVACLRRALAIARLRLGPDHVEVAALAGKVGSALVIAGSTNEGCALMGECIEIAGRVGNLEEFSRYFGLIGHAKMAQGRPQDALPFFEQEVSTCERYLRPSSVVAIARFNLGQCLRQLGRLEDARVELEQAMAIAKARRADPAFTAAVGKELALIRRGA